MSPNAPELIKTEQTLISKIFRRKSAATTKVELLSDAASMISTAPLVKPDGHGQPDPMRTTSNEEQTAFNSLMDKAKTMSPEEFKAYLCRHKEDVEAMYRRQGGGITGGDWIYRDPTDLSSACRYCILALMRSDDEPLVGLNRTLKQGGTLGDISASCKWKALLRRIVSPLQHEIHGLE
ncbi:hypothetical protein AYL99_09532 [Fonsecaea erecta]|uniref:Uncharacterized protein n=1 Tax=Fonsecaea erecta TaxID=1367422 RepID=A0A178ZAY8_9EURO|nr:hypothetical protein AYL99_09532 [Fonsecaea erecta]OAP56353.1 hypothetical protein AYL99_09532 [Fonsecaea erecta]